VQNESMTVSRIVRRKPNPGSEAAYEALIRDMVGESSRFPGYLSTAVIPPHTDGDNGEYLIVQRFATQLDLERWDNSAESGAWHQKARLVADNNAAYHSVDGLGVWFAPERTMPVQVAPKWKMTVVSWLGIFPSAATSLWLIDPILSSWPFAVRMAVIIALVAFLMAYVVMPRLTVWMKWWLRDEGAIYAT